MDRPDCASGRRSFGQIPSLSSSSSIEWCSPVTCWGAEWILVPMPRPQSISCFKILVMRLGLGSGGVIHLRGTSLNRVVYGRGKKE